MKRLSAAAVAIASLLALRPCFAANEQSAAYWQINDELSRLESVARSLPASNTRPDKVDFSKLLSGLAQLGQPGVTAQGEIQPMTQRFEQALRKPAQAAANAPAGDRGLDKQAAAEASGILNQIVQRARGALAAGAPKHLPGQTQDQLGAAPGSKRAAALPTATAHVDSSADRVRRSFQDLENGRAFDRSGTLALAQALPARSATRPVADAWPARDAVAQPPVPLPRARPMTRGDIRQLQTDYNAARQPGAKAIKVDGVAGPETRRVLAAFQKDRKVGDGSGKLDRATLAAAAAEADAARASRIVPGDPRKDAVNLLQDQLGRVPGVGFVPQNGKYDGMLQSAVKRFQKKYDLPVTGVVDETTWLKISQQAAGRERTKLLPENEVWYSKKVPPALAAKISQAAQEAGISPSQMLAFVWTEGGATAGRSSAGAKGVAQITRPTAQTYCKDLGWKAVSGTVDGNLKCAARIYRDLYNRTGGDAVLALAAYNAGPKYLGRVPAIKETVAYVVRNSRYHCELTGEKLLDPQRHIPPNMMDYARKADAIVAKWIADEGRTPNPACSAF